MTPEEQAALQAHFWGQPEAPIGPPAPAGMSRDPGASYYAAGAPPAPPAPDAPSSYDYWAGTRDVSAEATPAPPKPFSWNAPGYEGQQSVPFSGTSPVAPPAAPPPVVSDMSIPPAPPSRTEDGGRTPGTTLGTKPVVDAPLSGGPAPSRGGGGGGRSGPSDYDKANAGLRATYDVDKDAVSAEAAAERARAEASAVGAAALAQQKIDDQAIQQMEAQNAALKFADYSAETQRQIDDVRSKKIDVARAFSGEGGAFAAAIGGLLGGLYQGINKLEKNPFIEQMNKTMDRDIAVQETDLRTQKEGIGERRHLLAEMRATYKDEALATLQAKNLYYEGAKEAIVAQAAGYDSPVIQARADQAISALSREQSKLDVTAAIRKAAQAQAAAAAAEARRQRDFDNRLKLDEHSRKWAEAGIEAEKKTGEKDDKLAARFIGTGKDERGNPTGYLSASPEEHKEQLDARRAAGRILQQIDDVLAIRNKQGGAGRAAEQAVHGLYSTEANNQLKVLESGLTTDSAVAAKLGALSAMDRGLLTVKFENLNGVGSGAEERLLQVKRTLEEGLARDADLTAGSRATKVVEGGRERVILHGTSNAPSNPRAGPRTPVGR